MPRRPTPDGWKGGSDDFTYLRIIDGRNVVSPAATEAESKKVLDGDWTANAQSWDDIFYPEESSS